METPSTTPSYRIVVRLEICNRPGMFGRVATAIGSAGGNVGAIDIVTADSNRIVRDVAIDVHDSAHAEKVVAAVRQVEGVRVVGGSDRTFALHVGGKITIANKVPLKTRDDLSMVYTPGVARICQSIAENRENAYLLTIKKNTVAVVSDGSAVLGLGDIGPEAAMPVMEGKAMLFKEFGGVDAFPICLATQDPDEIVRTCRHLAPGFGGINLEDISAPRCFEIEERLQRDLDIPVFHDDQHGTAVVVLAALHNALKIVDKRPADLKVVVAGAGAAGIACSKALMQAGVRNVIGCDRHGVLYRGRKEHMNPMKEWLAESTNPENVTGSLENAILGADLFLGLSSPGVFRPEWVDRMAREPIIFAMANPDPEVMPEEVEGKVRIMATGRSDYPNQINNVLCFPGLFRGALDSCARGINEEMKLAAARAIAGVIGNDELSEEYIIPSVFDRRVAEAVAQAVAQAARETGTARQWDRHVSGSVFEHIEEGMGGNG